MLGFKEFNFRFIPRMSLFILLSVIAVGGSLYLVFGRGLNFGTDFKGGTRLQYRFQQPVTEGDLRKILEGLDLGDFSVQKVGRPEENRVVVKIEEKEDLELLSKKIQENFQSGLNNPDFILEQEESVGPKAGADLRKKGILAIVVSWLLMLIYIGYRFDFSFAPGAIIALIHDVLITLGGFALSGREVSLTVVAALMTIVGYSVNDTIVVYDRIRENAKKMEKMPLREMINRSINETLSRTIITNFTVLLVVILIYIFGEGEFQNFGFAMVIGSISGTYSTIFIASPCYIFLKEYGPRIQKFFRKS
ncbi:MAG: protein translocase subunit SecF [Deltaproteobacteria bacterium]|nr:protein translocase subunit SecF [Deltaproteobacteria bacterium]